MENLHLQLTFGFHIHQTSETEVTVFVYANDKNCLKKCICNSNLSYKRFLSDVFVH